MHKKWFSVAATVALSCMSIGDAISADSVNAARQQRVNRLQVLLDLASSKAKFVWTAANQEAATVATAKQLTLTLSGAFESDDLTRRLFAALEGNDLKEMQLGKYVVINTKTKLTLASANTVKSPGEILREAVAKFQSDPDSANVDLSASGKALLIILEKRLCNKSFETDASNARFARLEKLLGVKANLSDENDRMKSLVTSLGAANTESPKAKVAAVSPVAAKAPSAPAASQSAAPAIEAPGVDIESLVQWKANARHKLSLPYHPPENTALSQLPEIGFTVNKDGVIQNATILGDSSHSADEKAALAAVKDASIGQFLVGMPFDKASCVVIFNAGDGSCNFLDFAYTMKDGKTWKYTEAEKSVKRRDQKAWKALRLDPAARVWQKEVERRMSANWKPTGDVQMEFVNCFFKVAENGAISNIEIDERLNDPTFAPSKEAQALARAVVTGTSPVDPLPPSLKPSIELGFRLSNKELAEKRFNEIGRELKIKQIAQPDIQKMQDEELAKGPGASLLLDDDQIIINRNKFREQAFMRDMQKTIFESAPRLSNTRPIIVDFQLSKEGKVLACQLNQSGGTDADDVAAKAAVQKFDRKLVEGPNEALWFRITFPAKPQLNATTSNWSSDAMKAWEEEANYALGSAVLVEYGSRPSDYLSLNFIACFQSLDFTLNKSGKIVGSIPNYYPTPTTNWSCRVLRATKFPPLPDGVDTLKVRLQCDSRGLRITKPL
ncbi:MAG: hypothetical protein QG574_2625, partial [Cyanobacteriota bacterium erpe_2018_sw_21hr_WHONDRS-SW48-000092_B_bin.40]|nr:hypothetical protein [Cyanobacteriota bacterium erpe_2018_sw_21hr_WHONDRS-SW48-000092_B_bin.40]